MAYLTPVLYLTDIEMKYKWKRGYKSNVYIFYNYLFDS